MLQIKEEDYLVQRLDNQIEWYGKKASSNQKWLKVCKWIELVLAATIPVALIISTENCGKIIAASAAAIIATANGIQGIYKFHENWMDYRTTEEILKHEKYLYLARSGTYKNSSEPFQDLVERIESIISHENTNWSQLHQTKAKCKTT